MIESTKANERGIYEERLSIEMVNKIASHTTKSKELEKTANI
jgi:hypothetical protein